MVAGSRFVFTHFFYAASGDTVAIPLGSRSGAVLPVLSTTTAPTVTVAQGAGTNDLATITGGTTNGPRMLVTRHDSDFAGR